MATLDLSLMPERLAICRLPAGEPIPAWAMNAGGLTSVTRTSGELSVVCAESAVPPGTPCNAAWRAFRVQGPLDFSLTGVLLAIDGPLAAARISIFAVSTYDTDYVLVREENVERAVGALVAAGHRVER